MRGKSLLNEKAIWTMAMETFVQFSSTCLSNLVKIKKLLTILDILVFYRSQLYGLLQTVRTLSGMQQQYFGITSRNTSEKQIILII